MSNLYRNIIRNNNNKRTPCSESNLGNIIVSKNKCVKHKCNNKLKNKLKKYKLRKYGEEDKDVTDVSETLVKLLTIKSPIKTFEVLKNCENINLENRPVNYLTKMAKKRETQKECGGSDISLKNWVESDQNENSACSYQLRKPRKLQIKEYTKHTTDKTKTQNVIQHDNKIAESHELQSKNAFKLLMESRHKSMGTNSPGKITMAESNDGLNEAEKEEKRKIKTKRNLFLQNWADSKGALKKKELEESEEKYINYKMEKRSQNLKKMITKNCNSYEKKSHVSCNLDDQINTVNNSIEVPQINTLLSPNGRINPVCKVVAEDDEFLSKLSPSLRKRKNMLCYFKKIEKVDSTLNCNCDVQNDNAKKKSRKKKKEKQTIVIEGLTNEIEQEGNKLNNLSTNSIIHLDDSSETRSLYHGTESISETMINEEKTKEPLSINHVPDQPQNVRARRNVKRPIKYIDEEEISSSDEELHIFTPKKKKITIYKNVNEDSTVNNRVAKLVTKNIEGNRVKKIISKETNKVKQVTKKETKVKIAPIFSKKSELDTQALEAKQKFLQSGVPEQIKKKLTQKRKVTLENNCFPVLVHVQQLEHVSQVIHCSLKYNTNDSNCDKDFNTIATNFSINILKQYTNKTEFDIFSKPVDIDTVLKSIKTLYPKFPVYSTYRLLKSKNKEDAPKSHNYLDLDSSVEEIHSNMHEFNDANSDSLNWTDKYKAASTDQIIGNFHSIKELKKWLQSCKEYNCMSKNIVNEESDISDFYLSDSDSKDSVKAMNNLLILTGPVGSGKTSIVYAAAAELSIKVIEVNASSKRNGKIMLQDLQEATQSHKVDRGKGSSTESSQKLSQDINVDKAKKKFRRLKTSKEANTSKYDKTLKLDPVSLQLSQDPGRTGMSLILIDDADIVFDQDDGFGSAVTQIVQISKRPVILVTSKMSCLHLQKFIQSAKVLTMRAFNPRMLGTWLDIMCLADSGICCPGVGMKLLDFFKGDIRRAINCLHFYIASEKHSIKHQHESQKGANDKIFIDKEDSNELLTDNEFLEEDAGCSKKNIAAKNVWEYFRICSSFSLKIFDAWWSLPNLLNYNCEGSFQSQSEERKNMLRNLNVIAGTVDNISVADILCDNKVNKSEIITSPPWYNAESDSISDNEVLKGYDRNYEYLEDISTSIVNYSIQKAQTVFLCEDKNEYYFPDMSVHREKEKVLSLHQNLTNSLNASATLDRRALALDYWSVCRNICRIEKTKIDVNTKRNNRFCHYLRTLKATNKSEDFDMLGESLNLKKNS